MQLYLQELDRLYRAGNATEHSYRPALQGLLQRLLPDAIVTNEPKRISCGAPDYVLERRLKKDGHRIPFGYIEAKDVVEDIDHKKHDSQFKRYKESLDNLIITDYVRFDFYQQGERIASLSIADKTPAGLVAKPENFAQLNALIVRFANTPTQTIKNPEHLASLMASRAKLMAEMLTSALEADIAQGNATDLWQQMEAFKEYLINDITPRAFSDVYAQTIAYGLFAARYHDPTLETFSRQEAAILIPQSNPFLRKLFQHIAGFDLDSRIAWVVDELVSIFLATNVAQIMRHFGKRTAQQDPVIHFYETFLSEYDPALRKARGVWYTPQPVVSFMVRAVDQLLKSQFGLADGLTDESRISINVKVGAKDKSGKELSKTEQVHRVQILDPATGTGTFLAQTIEHLHCQFAGMQGAWNTYVQQHLLPRLNGFELLMASYAMAHLKLDMLLSETGYVAPRHNPERLRVFLTNSLEDHHTDTGSLFANWLSDEAKQADRIKQETPVMVVMGNPPYSGHSSNKGEWIERLLDSYKQEPSGGKLQERNPKWLNDDYVKFMRYAQHLVEKNGEGVVAFINPHGWLDNPTFRGMRYQLLTTFDDIYVIDLHGNSKKKETAPDGSKDDNVFDIMQGVCINLFVKTGKKAQGALAKLHHADLYGKRKDKYAFLEAQGIDSIAWQTLSPSEPMYFCVPRDTSLEAEYNQGFSLADLFPVNVLGFQTHRDHFAIDTDKQALFNRMSDMRDDTVTDEVFTHRYELHTSSSWKLPKVRQQLKTDEQWQEKLIPVAYRPFDDRWGYFSEVAMDRPRKELKAHVMGKKNWCLNVVRQTKSSTWQHAVITEKPAPAVFVEIKDGCTAFPLYLYPEGEESVDKVEKTHRIPNLNPAIVQKMGDSIGLTFVPECDDRDKNETFCPLDLLDYAYAVLHSPHYRTTYKDFLKTDFPRIPYPKHAQGFFTLAALGAQLRQWHLLTHADAAHTPIGYVGDGDNRVEAPKFADNRVWINASQYFDAVPEAAWMAFIGGYQPAQKWLKDRKGETLSRADIMHYRQLVFALMNTQRLMQLIDTVMLS